MSRRQNTRIAVFTSGGDAQGMNAALRACVRLAINQRAEIFYIRDGYKGMIAGEIEQATWESVENVIQTGGTFIGSARSKEFMTVEGRRKAALSLATHGITALICIGGDGSLTGLQMLQSEWREHIEALRTSGAISQQSAETVAHLRVVGLVGSIDNDFAASDMTIGTDSALTRIVEAIDAVVDTAQSHQRTFVIEVMGRHCGYLALTAALATEADYVFLPECTPGDRWEEEMCERLAAMRGLGRRLNVVIVAEGATDASGQKITPEAVQRVVEDRLKYDTRVTKLGHVQRGGRASFLDRLLGTRMGAEALNEKAEPCVIAIEGNKLKRVALGMAIEQNTRAFARGDLETVVQLRGRTFAEKIEFLRTTAQRTKKVGGETKEKGKEETESAPRTVDGTEEEERCALAVMHVGAPAAGMNAVTHAFVRVAMAAGYTVYGVQESMSGLAAGKLEELSWSSVAGWVSKGGSMLGTRKETVDEPYAVAGVLARYRIGGLLIVGGFEAFSSSLSLASLRSSPVLAALRIPIVVVPATISNNVPGTRVSIGSDTALNEISRLIDYVKQSAIGTKGRSFIVETQGGRCGYLAAMGGLAGAADGIHIFEESVDGAQLDREVKDAERRARRHGAHNYLLVRGEGCATDSQTVLRHFETSTKMSTRLTVFGHVQQGGSPSVFDRQMGLRMGAKAAQTLLAQLKEAPPLDERKGVFMIGLRGSSLHASACSQLEACFEHRTHGDTHWWRRLTQLARVLASDVQIPEETQFCTMRAIGSVTSETIDLSRMTAGGIVMMGADTTCTCVTHWLGSDGISFEEDFVDGVL